MSWGGFWAYEEPEEDEDGASNPYAVKHTVESFKNPGFFVASIAEAIHITAGLVDGARATYNIIPHHFVNGDYLQTPEYKNGQRVYVKICGAQVSSATERVCIFISPTRTVWWVGRPSEYGQNRRYALIRMNSQLRHLDLHELVKYYTDRGAALQVEVACRVHAGKPMQLVFQPTAKISTKPIDAAIQDLHDAGLSTFNVCD